MYGNNLYMGNNSYIDLLSSSSVDDDITVPERKYHPVVTIVMASISSSLEIFLGISIGAILAHPRLGVLSNSGIRRRLGKSLIYVLAPLFHLRNFSLGMDPQLITSLWILPLWGFFQWIWQYLISELLFIRCSTIEKMWILFNRKIIVRIFGRPIRFPVFLSNLLCCCCWIERYFSSPRKKKIDGDEKETELEEFERKKKELYIQRICVFCSGLGNCGFFPMVFVTSLALNSKVFPDPLVEEHSYAFISLYIISHPAFFYSYIFNLIKFLSEKVSKESEELNNKISNDDLNHDEEIIQQQQQTSEEEEEEEKKKNESESEKSEHSSSEEKVKSEEEEEEEGGEGGEELTSTSIQSSDDNINNNLEQQSEISNQEDHSNQSKEESNSKNQNLSHLFRKICSRNCLSSVFKVVSKTLLNPVVGGMGMGMIIGSITPLKTTLFESPPPVLEAFANISEKIGDSFLGLALIVVGAGLGSVLFGERPSKYDIKQGTPKERAEQLRILQRQKRIRLESRNTQERFKGGIRRIWKDIKYTITIKHVPKVDLIRCCLIKLVLFPIISFSMTALFVFTIGPIVIKDENIRGLIYVILMVEGGVPVMMTLPMVCSIFDFGTEVLAEVMLVQYLIAPITLAIYTTGVLYFVCSIEKCNL